MRRRLRAEDGQGLIELLAAMAILSVAVAALLGVFVASALSVNRATVRSTALTVASRQMEVYRSLDYACIPVTAGGTLTRPATPTTCPATPASFPNEYAADQLASGTATPDGRTYDVQTVVTLIAGGTEKQISVTVRQGSATGPVVGQQTSYFSLAGSA